MTEIQTRLLAEKGPAVLFENVVRADGTRSDMPVLVNLFGTVERVAWGMDREPHQLRAGRRDPGLPAPARAARRLARGARHAADAAHRDGDEAPHGGQRALPGDRATGDDIDLGRLPIQTCWPGEPAPLITWPLIVTQGPNPKGDKQDSFNLGIYRLQVTGRNTTLMRWLKHRGGAQHHQRWKGAGKREPLPVAAVIGADPGTILAAVTPVPDTLSEYQFAGLLRGKKVELVDCKTVPLKVPAEAEIVLEGHVSLDDYGDEGPYGDHTGYYNSVEKFPVFTLERHHHAARSRSISRPSPAGRPTSLSVLGEALNEVFIPLFQQQFPEIVDFWLPPEGCSYRIAVVSMKKAYAGHAKRVMMGVWSYLRQFMYTKWVIVVDAEIDARNWKDVMWAVSTRMDPARDITVIENTPIDYLDFASPVSGLGSKIGLDATDKFPGETNREWGRQIRMDQAVIDKVDAMWSELGLPGSGKKIWR